MFGQNLRLSDSKNRHLNRNVALIIDNCPAHPKIDDLTNFILPTPQHTFQNSAYGFRNYQELQNFLQNISRSEKNSANGRRGRVRTQFIGRDDGNTIEETSFMDELHGIISSFQDAQDGTVSPQKHVEIEYLVNVADLNPPQLFLDQELSKNSRQRV